MSRSFKRRARGNLSFSAPHPLSGAVKSPLLGAKASAADASNSGVEATPAASSTGRKPAFEYRGLEQPEYLELWQLPPSASPPLPAPSSAHGPIGGQGTQPVIEWSQLVHAADKPHTIMAEYLERWMVKRGVRGVQVAVYRNDELKLSMALTHAEPGYLPIEVTHKFRLASVAKWLTGMAAVRFMGPRAASFTLTSKLTEVLGVPTTSPSYPVLSQIAAKELLTHRSGWGEQSSGGWGAIGQVLGKTLLEPGDYRAYLASPASLNTFGNELPFYTQYYSGFNFFVLGEIVSAVAGSSSYDLYDLSMRTFWGFNPQNAPTAQNGWTAAWTQGEPPCHNRFPAIVQSGDPPTWTPYQFQVHYPADVAAGGWIMTMESLGRILSRLSPLSASPLLTEEEVRLMASPYELPGGDLVEPGHGCNVVRAVGAVPPGTPTSQINTLVEQGMPWGGGPHVPIDVLWHNGEGSGCNAMAIHVIPSQGSASPSLSLALAVNLNPGDAGLFGTEAMELVGVLREIEKRQLWPDGDVGDS